MESMNAQYKDLNEFLSKHNSNKTANENRIITHTRIGDKSMNINGGSYNIPKNELTTFYRLYYDHVFVKKNYEYLTEKQIENGPILIDLDFRYSYDVEEKQHKHEHIIDLLSAYLDELKEFFLFEKEKMFPIFVMEKPEVNRLSDGSKTKDGIHIIMGIQMNHIMQMMLRKRMIEKIDEIWGDSLPLINDWESVLDDGISKGTTNWQLYGSRKPGNEAYGLKYYYEVTYDDCDGEFMMEDKTNDFNMSNNFNKLSAQYDENIMFETNPKIKSEYEKNCKNGGKNTKPIPKVKLVTGEAKNTDEDNESNEEEEDTGEIAISDITSQNVLIRAVSNMLKKLNTNEQHIREIHEFTQILPEKYYEPGSHNLNTQVSFALKHTDERLFLSWVMLRSKASDFDYHSIPDLYAKWKKLNVKQDGITKKSIIYWAKQDAYEEYNKIRRNTIDYYLEITINNGQTEHDFAMVLYQIFKDKYVCSSIKQSEWYVFNNHRWERDLGYTLRYSISKEMHQIYSDKIQRMQSNMHVDGDIQKGEKSEKSEKDEKMRKKVNTAYTIMNRLKKTSDKNNIIREAAEIFYDKDFIKNMDSNKYLMCFSNGVVDFKNGIFRAGYPQDYITKSTGLPYIDHLNNPDYSEIKENIVTFMEQLFPDISLNRYVWHHLASVLIGENKNQTFNIYQGSGSNGKSMLTDLMSKALGDYKGVVPITLVTDKRTSLGGTCSELMQLKGVRYAVMQEPSKDARINEGIMKELTGGDPIQGRQLYSESETFMPQFSLVVCTNNLPEIGSNDDGTWRRIRIVPFMAKFLDEGHDDWNDPEILYKFVKDKNLKDQLSVFAPVFASMLIKIAFETKGNVEDCDIVMASSNKYRQTQDIFTAFISEMVEKKEGGKISLDGLYQEFKKWYGVMRKIPKRQELYDIMDKKFGKNKNKCWLGVSIVVPDDGDMYQGGFMG